MRIKSLYKKPIKDSYTLKNILIIGSSEFGITNEVIEVTNEKDVIMTYGRNGSIYESYKSIKDEVSKYNIGVFVIKYGGEHATASFNINTKESIINDALIFKSIYSNELYNDIRINITSVGIEMIFPLFFNLNPKIYHYKDFPNLYMLIKQINEDTINGENVIFAQANVDDFTEFDESFALINESKNLSNGDSGLNLSNNEKFMALELTYELIQGLELDYIVLPDVFYNDEVTTLYVNGRRCSFYEQLLSFSISQLNYSIITLGILQINTDSFNNDNPDIHIEKLKELMITTHSNSSLADYRFLITLVYDYLIIGHNLNKISSSILIALELAKLETTRNITNSPINENYYLNILLNSEQIKELSDLGIISFRLSPYHNRVVPVNGITNYTYLDSDIKQYNNEYKYLTSVVLLQNTIPKLKSILEANIGKSIYSLEKDKKMEDELLVVLSNLVKKEILTKYSISITYDVESGTINLELILQNIFVTEGIKYIGKLSYFDLE